MQKTQVQSQSVTKVTSVPELQCGKKEKHTVMESSEAAAIRAAQTRPRNSYANSVSSNHAAAAAALSAAVTSAAVSLSKNFTVPNSSSRVIKSATQQLIDSNVSRAQLQHRAIATAKKPSQMADKASAGKPAVKATVTTPVSPGRPQTEAGFTLPSTGIPASLMTGVMKIDESRNQHNVGNQHNAGRLEKKRKQAKQPLPPQQAHPVIEPQVPLPPCQVPKVPTSVTANHLRMQAPPHPQMPHPVHSQHNAAFVAAVNNAAAAAAAKQEMEARNNQRNIQQQKSPGTTTAPSQTQLKSPVNHVQQPAAKKQLPMVPAEATMNGKSAKAIQQAQLYAANISNTHKIPLPLSQPPPPQQNGPAPQPAQQQAGKKKNKKGALPTPQLNSSDAPASVPSTPSPPAQPAPPQSPRPTKASSLPATPVKQQPGRQGQHNGTPSAMVNGLVTPTKPGRGGQGGRGGSAGVTNPRDTQGGGDRVKGEDKSPPGKDQVSTSTGNCSLELCPHSYTW